MSGRPAIVEQIRGGSHWRVEIRPAEYEERLLADVDDCLEAVRLAKVSLRGCDYPHLPSDHANRAIGSHSVSSWTDFASHLEFWTFFQSGQFVHLFAVKEAASWDAQLRTEYAGHVREGSDAPGFIHIGNCLWTITEIFEFAARLCERTVYRDRLHVTIGLHGIKGFALTTDANRAWNGHYTASESELTNTWRLRAAELVARRDQQAIDAAAWFFKRFGWLSPNVDALRQQQSELLKRSV